MKKTLLLFLLLAGCVSIKAQIAFSSGEPAFAVSSSEFAAIQVFPNPAVEFFNVTPNPKIEYITIYNLLGRQMKSFTYSESDRYYVGDLPKGMYLVQMSGSDSRLLSTQRLSKR
jgi:hypothetical protein